MYQIGSFHHCVFLFNNHLLPLPGAMDASNGSQQLGPKICLSKNRLVAWTDNISWILSFATCTCKNLEAHVSLYISNQNFHGCIDTSPKAYRLIMTNQHLMVPFHYQWFASKTFFTFCHRRSAFRRVSTFLTDDWWLMTVSSSRLVCSRWASSPLFCRATQKQVRNGSGIAILS